MSVLLLVSSLRSKSGWFRMVSMAEDSWHSRFCFVGARLDKKE